MRNKGAVVWCAAAMLAGAIHARAAEGSGWLDPAADMRQGREALFAKRYAAAARLCAAAYLEDPANEEARRCLREAARAGASEDVLAIQEEGGQIMKKADKSRRVSQLIEQRRYLEVYDLLYGALEADRQDDWARGQLEKLQRAVGDRLPGDLGLDEHRRNAVLGFYYLAQKKLPSLCRVRAHWSEALQQTGIKIPESRIRRYLSWIERKGIACAQAPPDQSGPLTMQAMLKELDELLK